MKALVELAAPLWQGATANATGGPGPYRTSVQASGLSALREGPEALGAVHANPPVYCYRAPRQWAANGCNPGVGKGHLCEYRARRRAIAGCCAPEFCYFTPTPPRTGAECHPVAGAGQIGERDTPDRFAIVQGEKKGGSAHADHPKYHMESCRYQRPLRRRAAGLKSFRVAFTPNLVCFSSFSRP